MHRAVYIAGSGDFGATFGAERRVSVSEVGVCGCCGLKAFAPGPGQLAIVYRSADSGANRDMVLIVSTNAGQTFASRTLGKWKVSTCPMSTPALGTSPDGRLFVMWETDGQVFWTQVNPLKTDEQTSVLAAGGTPRERKHPRFAYTGGSNPEVVITWVEGTGWEKGGALAWQAGPGMLGRQDGVRPWTFSAAFADPLGGFTILY